MSEQWPADPPPEFSGIRFHFDEGDSADYVVLLNCVEKRREATCAPNRVWTLVQEPPTKWHRRLHEGPPESSRVYTTDLSLSGPRYRHFWGAMEWHIGLSYEQLVAAARPPKTVDLAWVTSNLNVLPGHQKRMRFLQQLQQSDVPVDLWGRGIRPAESKWHALSPARYSIAFENHARSPYWSEKLSDCFLAFSTPLYYGSNEVSRYFPPDSYISIDPDDRFVVEKLRDAVRSRHHEDNFAALLEARERCLKDYNTLFFIAQEIVRDDDKARPQQRVVLNPVRGFEGTLFMRIETALAVAARRLLPPKIFAWARAGYARVRRRQTTVTGSGSGAP